MGMVLWDCWSIHAKGRRDSNDSDGLPMLNGKGFTSCAPFEQRLAFLDC